MDLKYLVTEQKENILLIKINRPEALNALNTTCLSEINHIFSVSEKNEQVKGIIISGTGDKAFASGGDIKEINRLTVDLARKLSVAGNNLMKYIEQFKKPVIAAINGIAYGGGCELAMACHLRIASESSNFALPEANLGISTGLGGLQRIVQLVGKGKAYELAFLGEPIDAYEAKKIGLVNFVVPHEGLIDRSMDLMKKILEKSPVSIRAVIKSINAYYYNTDGFETEMAEFINCFSYKDFKKGIRAFTEKRKPDFK